MNNKHSNENDEPDVSNPRTNKPKDSSREDNTPNFTIKGDSAPGFTREKFTEFSMPTNTGFDYKEIDIDYSKLAEDPGISIGGLYRHPQKEVKQEDTDQPQAKAYYNNISSTGEENHTVGSINYSDLAESAGISFGNIEPQKQETIGINNQSTELLSTDKIVVEGSIDKAINLGASEKDVFYLVDDGSLDNNITKKESLSSVGDNHVNSITKEYDKNGTSKYIESSEIQFETESFLPRDETGLPISIPYIVFNITKNALENPLGKIKQYVLLKELGAGGMGKVFYAYDSNLNKPVVIKTILNKSSDNNIKEIFQKRFRHAAQLTANLRNKPGVVSVYTSGYDEEYGSYYAMEYVEGVSLKDIADYMRDNKLPETVALLWITSILENLKLLHNNRILIVHRDIKPHNIILNSHGELVICDLGLSKALESTEEDNIDEILLLSGKYNHSLTASRGIIGTPEYAPPEQLGGILGDKNPEKLSVSADIYSLGATIYQLLTQKSPYPKKDIWEKIDSICHPNTSPQDINEFRSDLNKGFKTVIKRMMAKRPQDRYQNIDDVLTEIEEIKSKLAYEFL